MRPRWHRGIWLAALVACTVAQAARNRDPLQVTLKPPAAVKGAARNEAQRKGAAARNLELRVEDARGPGAGANIGHASSDGEVLFAVLADNPVTPFVQAVAQHTLASWDLTHEGPAHGSLRLRYSGFEVDAQAHAIGTTYVGSVRLDWALFNQAGHEVAHGSAQGGMQHYGRSRSAVNVNEALAGAVEAALTQVASDPGFRKLWADSFQSEGAPPPAAAPPVVQAPRRVQAAGKPAPTAPPESPIARIMQRLRQLDELHERKVITQEEYDKRRAAIIDEI